MSDAAEEVDGDETEIDCPCGQRFYFDETPEEGHELECDCGKTLTISMVSWSAFVTASVKRRGEG